MTNHPITPPPELLHQWATEYWGNPGESIGEGEKYIATQAARWGANQELEACCRWLETYVQRWAEWSANFRAARRPKPPSLKEQAFELVRRIEGAGSPWELSELSVIRRALEQLDD